MINIAPTPNNFIPCKPEEDNFTCPGVVEIDTKSYDKKVVVNLKLMCCKDKLYTDKN